MIDPNRLLWLDLETTGLSPERDSILEVAVAVTDRRFEIRAADVWVVAFDGPVDTWAATNHRQLLELCKQSHQTLSTVEWAIVAFIDAHCPANERLVLAGSSIHFDRAFVRARMPNLEHRLHYRMLDVSSFKEALRAAGHSYREGGAKAHRAMPDVEASVDELRNYLERIL